ncbi:MAG: type restriction enzyme Eco57I (Endonuclease Eco57I), partial [Bacteroidetes bacterium]|nr:type restriction enzyme Eco57I (Endonuclease Eco57I) [Bacteroidota bacterium]
MRHLRYHSYLPACNAMTAPKEIIKLVERFERNRDQYTSGNYNEAQLRQEFLNPFFSALGWDVENQQGYAEPYKEVIHEDAIKIGSATKAPDYAFRIGGTRKFFVEAKNPSVNLKEDISPSYQLRRYAWSAKLPLSILTDFQEFVIYDCRTKPLKTDKASTGRVRYLTYNDYATEWDSIASVFSKEALLKGSFDKFAESTKGKKGTTEVDDAFLKEIESWRDILAKNIALRNVKLSQPELNFSVQRTIDRIIFLRICEDRGIEPYAKLLTLVNGERVYRRLYEQFYRADEKYNSGLFHFEHEKERAERPDELTPNLHIDDKPLKEIIGNLYYPDCPYEFSVLPADILGQVYEQFLGKVIRLTAGHQAKVEEKPEVKKAGGVYYTPTYIVNYIVKNTVGKLLDPDPPLKKGDVILSPVGKGSSSNDGTPASSNAFSEAGRKDLNHTRTDREKATKPTKPLTPKEASKLRILDPACGSGSFLIGAYQYLLNWHRDWYEKDRAEKHTTGKNAALFRGPGGEWRLTTGERKRILLNNIYG